MAEDNPSMTLVAQRDLNCLVDDNRQTRKRALTKLGTLPSAGHPPEVLAQVWNDLLRTPITRIFGDAVEKNRELAITLTSELFAVLPDATLVESLTLVVPAIVARIGNGAALAEESEELRLLLLELVHILVKRCGTAVAAHLPEVVQVLVASYADPFPDAKKAGCAIALSLSEAVPSHIEAHCAALISALAPALSHQHSRVRSTATEALFALLLREPSLVQEVAPQLALISTDRAPAVREQAVHALADLLARLPSHRARRAPPPPPPLRPWRRGRCHRRPRAPRWTASRTSSTPPKPTACRASSTAAARRATRPRISPSPPPPPPPRARRWT